MTQFLPVTDADLARARHDPAFRQRLLATSLRQLLTELGRRRQTGSAGLKLAQELREGSLLAVKLADLISRLDGQRQGALACPVSD